MIKYTPAEKWIAEVLEFHVNIYNTIWTAHNKHSDRRNVQESEQCTHNRAMEEMNSTHIYNIQSRDGMYISRYH